MNAPTRVSINRLSPLANPFFFRYNPKGFVETELRFNGIMPIYLYRCENCGFQFEQQQKFSDDPLIMCPECGQETAELVVMVEQEFVVVVIRRSGEGIDLGDGRR